ncbi:hypothetical protein [Dyadobacter luticola]|uniref:Bacterial surface antigen (D15) domain-containing protein n=1 Tax=Dyadobacter luticola TaxID=1979387 RepID=A0A5R9KT99_9BACT|nr:hypothetical protein [Dyadobacter luticola]TLU99430.1 hypothetical protein FEN17_23005 [Dyadobacter luticola]
MCKYLLLLMLVSGFASAQNPDSKIAYRRDSIRYTNLKARMSKTKFSRAVYRLFFRDVYNQGKVSEVKAIETNPFTPYEGMVIRKIYIRQLDILGESVYDTTRTGNRLQRFLSKNLHTNTREGIIRKSFLLFSEGDDIEARVLKDNERLLRSNKTITDARIIVIPRKDVTWMADVVVLVQDAWSIVVGGSFSSFNKLSAKVEDINVRGTTHSQLTAVRWDAKDSIRKFQFRTIYTVPYIGKTFITGQASFIFERDIKDQSVRFYRRFLTNETKYAGAVDVGHTTLLQNKRKIDSTDVQIPLYPAEFQYYDVWLGRSFKYPFPNSRLAQNSRIVVAARHNRYRFLDRPAVSPDMNKIYWNRSATLISLGFSNRNYKRDVLIYGFGRTEDVPVGSLFALTLGQENTEFGQRGYGGIQYAVGKYLSHNLGYMYGVANVGSYSKNGRAQQGVISSQLNYISNLIPFNYSFFRQFLTIRYTHGIRRDSVDYLNISNDQGIRGINNDQLIGTKRITVGTETVFFSDKSLLGFRIAYFVFADIGLVNAVNSIWSGPLYQGYGLGLRLRNENLTFNTLQLRIGYYPNLPNNSSPFRFGANGNVPLRLRDFDTSAPSIVPLQ